MPTNPILDELSGLSPGAQQALMGAHTASTVTPPAPPSVAAPGLQAPSKIQKPAQIGAPNISSGGLDSRGAADNPNVPKPEPTLQPPSMGTEVPNIGTPTMPNVTKQPTALEALTAKRDEMADKGAGITQIHSKIENSQFGQNHPTLGKIAGYGAEIPLRVLEAAGAMLGPVRSAEQMLPGTQLHHGLEMRNLNTTIGNESKENLQGAQAGEANARANALENPADKYTALPTDTGYAAFDTRKGTANTLTDQAGQPLSPVDKTKASAPHFETLQDGSVLALHTDAQGHTTPEIVYKGDPKIQTDLTTQEINGVQHTVVLNKQTGELIKDVGPTGFKAPVVNVNAGNAELDRESGRLGKPYQTGFDAASKSLDNIDKTIRSIDAGYKGQALALPETLTSLVSGQGTGVRVTMPELNMIGQHNGVKGDIESFFNRISGEGSMTDEDKRQLKGILRDARQRIIEKQTIHQQALDAINGAGSRADAVAADKQARQKLVDLERGSSESSGKGVSLKDAMALPSNKGKSEADVRKDIEAHGHTVTP